MQSLARSIVRNVTEDLWIDILKYGVPVEYWSYQKELDAKKLNKKPHLI